MMSRAALGVCARTGLIVCLAGEPRLAAECSSQTIGHGVKASKTSIRIIKTCRLNVKTADVISAESIANWISAQLDPHVTATRARYLSATPVSPPLELLLWAGEPHELNFCNTCSSGQSNASRIKAHVKGKHGSDMVSAPTATCGQYITFGNDARAIAVIEHVVPFHPLERPTPKKRALVESFVNTSPAKLPCVTRLSTGVSARNVCQFLADTRLYMTLTESGSHSMLPTHLHARRGREKTPAT
jgi:hypothetical protein